MNTSSRTTVIMNYVLLTICALIAIYPLVGVFLASLYEAARVDGANAIHEFFAVTLPGLRYELQVVLVLSLIDTLGTFDEIYVMTSGGPGTATSVPAYLVWRRMFQTSQVGSAAALGITLMLIIFAVAWVANKLMDRWGNDE